MLRHFPRQKLLCVIIIVFLHAYRPDKLRQAGRKGQYILLRVQHRIKGASTQLLYSSDSLLGRVKPKKIVQIWTTNELPRKSREH